MSSWIELAYETLVDIGKSLMRTYGYRRLAVTYGGVREDASFGNNSMKAAGANALTDFGQHQQEVARKGAGWYGAGRDAIGISAAGNSWSPRRSAIWQAGSPRLPHLRGALHVTRPARCRSGGEAPDAPFARLPPSPNRSMIHTSSFRHLAGTCVAIAAGLIGCGGGTSSASDVATPDSTTTQPSAPVAETPSQGTSMLRVAKAGAGRVTAEPAGIDCGIDCAAIYDSGAVITLAATAPTGSDFEGWGGACSGAQSTCDVTLKDSVTVTVSFINQTDAKASVDEIIAAMPPNSWKALPFTQMKDVCPLPYDRYACENVMAAWSGGAYDQKRDRMIVYGGGHADSWYNNIFAFDLPTMQWYRLSEMSTGTGSEPGLGWRDIRVESCGFYPKGEISLPSSVMKGAYVDGDMCDTHIVASQLDYQQPRSSHTYGKVFVDRLNDRYCYMGGSYYPSAQTSSTRVVCFDPVARSWSRAADQPTNVGGSGQTAEDRLGRIWYLTNTSGPIARFDPSANAWSTFGGVHGDAGGGADIDRSRGHYYALAPVDDGKSVLRKWDLAQPGAGSVRVRPTEVTDAIDTPSGLGTRPGFVYADDKDRFYAWGGGRDIHVFDPTSQRWTRHQATGDDPGDQQRWGTFGRFRYSAARKVFVLTNRTTQNVFIYKPQ